MRTRTFHQCIPALEEYTHIWESNGLNKEQVGGLLLGQGRFQMLANPGNDIEEGWAACWGYYAYEMVMFRLRKYGHN